MSESEFSWVLSLLFGFVLCIIMISPTNQDLLMIVKSDASILQACIYKIVIYLEKPSVLAVFLLSL